MRDKLLSLALLGFVLFGLGCPQGANSQTVDDSQAAYAPSPQNLDEAKKQVQRYRELAKKDPDRFLPDLAAALNNLGLMYSSLGRYEEALKTTEEAVKIYRELAKKNPDRFLSVLAIALTNLGLIYSDLGRYEEALKPAEEAVKYSRELSKKNPDMYLSVLVMALTNLGLIYSDLGRYEEALKPTEEAVKYYRELAKKNPDRFLPYLAQSLMLKSAILLQIGGEGNCRKAKEILKEAHDMLKPYYEKYPQRWGGLMRVISGLMEEAKKCE